MQYHRSINTIYSHEAFVAMRRSEDRCQAVTTHHATGMTTGPSQIQPVGCGTWGNHPCRDEYDNVLDIPCHMEIFFPSNAFMASARSFNTLYDIAKAVMANWDSRPSTIEGHKRELVKDLYIVQ